MGDRTAAPVEGEWRCSACGHGENLYACAYGVISGALLPNGDVSQDEVDQTELAEDSIDCHEHPSPGGGLERFLGGCWHRWQNCEWRSDDGYYYCQWGRKTYRLGDQKRGPCPACEGAGGEWVPIEPAEALDARLMSSRRP